MPETSFLFTERGYLDLNTAVQVPFPAAELARQVLARAGHLVREAKSPAPAVSQADQEWLCRVRDGDEAAASELIQRLFPTVIKSVRAHLPRRTQEQDLAQIIFAKVFQKLDQFSGLVPLEHWVSRIAVNTCLTELRRESSRPELRMSDLSEDEQLAVQHLSASEADLSAQQSSESRELLHKLLSVLKPEERLIVTWLHLQEKSTQEISALTGWSVSRIKVKAFRARAKLRRAWKRLTRRAVLTH